MKTTPKTDCAHTQTSAQPAKGNTARADGPDVPGFHACPSGLTAVTLPSICCRCQLRLREGSIFFSVISHEKGSLSVKGRGAGRERPQAHKKATKTIAPPARGKATRKKEGSDAKLCETILNCFPNDEKWWSGTVGCCIATGGLFSVELCSIDFIVTLPLLLSRSRAMRWRGGVRPFIAGCFWHFEFIWPQNRDRGEFYASNNRWWGDSTLPSRCCTIISGEREDIHSEKPFCFSSKNFFINIAPALLSIISKKWQQKFCINVIEQSH